jgi:hypothetical protein
MQENLRAYRNFFLQISLALDSHAILGVLETHKI